MGGVMDPHHQHPGSAGILIFFRWFLLKNLVENDLISQYEYRSQLNKLEAEKAFYTLESAKAVKDLNELTTNQSKLEKFAREKYLMKKENEDVFVIIQEAAKEEKKSSFFGN